MSKDRKLNRRHLIYYLRVFDRNTGQLIGHLADITSDGIMLTGEYAVETKTIFQLRMELPEGIKENKQIVFDAKSLWCRRDIDLGFYETGFQLQDLDSKDTEIIERLIGEFGLKDGFCIVI